MSISTIITDSFDRSFDLYQDLIDSIDEQTLNSKLPDLPSNSVGLQLWCVIGARESYTNAIKANKWSGFSCSLNSPTKKMSVTDALHRSAEGVSEIMSTFDSFTDVQNRLIVDLLEHEASHQGQLIRYLYGLQLTIPDSWKTRFNLQ